MFANSASAMANFIVCASSEIPSAISSGRRTISLFSKRSRETLAFGGKLVMDLMDGEWMRRHFEPRSWEWIDQNHFVCRERSLAEDHDRLISREIVVHAERGVITDQFYAERLYSKERLEALLSGAGFSNLRFYSASRTELVPKSGPGHGGAPAFCDLRDAASGTTRIASKGLLSALSRHCRACRRGSFHPPFADLRILGSRQRRAATVSAIFRLDTGNHAQTAVVSHGRFAQLRGHWAWY